MPWGDLSVMEQREEFVRLALTPGANKSELCRRFGISREKGYKWLRRYASEGRSGLSDRSRRPLHSPARSSEAVEREVLRLRAASKDAWGGRKIAAALRRAGYEPVPAASTITAILRRHDKLQAGAAAPRGSYQRFERETPNELWQMDFKGHFATAAGRCHPLTVLDDHSRYGLGLEACGDEQGSTVCQRLTAVFHRYGLPEEMLMDNGPPWGDVGGQPYTQFTVWLIRLGIAVIHGRPYHPQTQGKDERFHRTLKAEVLQGEHFKDLAQTQRAFDRWRHVYNYERPHDALGLDTPGDRYRPSPRSFPETLPEVEYGPGDIVRKVDCNGDFSFKNRRFRIGKAFQGQHIALRHSLEDGRFSVHFCRQQIGCIDLRGATSSARGLVDIANATTTSPRAQPQQKRETRI